MTNEKIVDALREYLASGVMMPAHVYAAICAAIARLEENNGNE